MSEGLIIGNGNIAKCLTPRAGAIFFASGVSNSRCRNENHEFNRERQLLYSMPSDKCLFYFSSIGIDLKEKAEPYFIHKLVMEQRVRYFKHHVIIRIGNLIGDTNPNTFINYIKDRQAKGLSVEIRDEYKYMIDGETLNMLCQTLPLDQKIEISVATKIAKVRDLIQ